MGRQSMTDQRRVEICRALQKGMLGNGSYERTSIKDIAQKAGVATGLIHHYFKNKEEILIMVAEIELQSIHNDIDELWLSDDEDERMSILHDFVYNQARNQFCMMLYSLSLSMPSIKELILAKRNNLLENLTLRLKNKGNIASPAKEANTISFYFENTIMQSVFLKETTCENLLKGLLINNTLYSKYFI